MARLLATTVYPASSIMKQGFMAMVVMMMIIIRKVLLLLRCTRVFFISQGDAPERRVTKEGKDFFVDGIVDEILARWSGNGIVVTSYDIGFHLAAPDF